jgi:hypothetical protein
MSAARLTSRLTRVAAQMGLCAIHGEPLVCVCGITWTGTAAEWDELCRLADCLLPYDAQIPHAGQVCPQCTGDVSCLTCYRTAWRALPIPVDLMSPAAWRRTNELLGLLRIAPPGAAGRPRDER